MTPGTKVQLLNAAGFGFDVQTPREVEVLEPDAMCERFGWVRVRVPFSGCDKGWCPQYAIPSQLGEVVS